MTRPTWAPTLADLHVYGGGALLALGAGLWSLPAGLVTAGAVLFGLGFTVLRRR